jgi:nodulation protein E
MTRVVITGLGFISALGRGAASTWSALKEGRSGIAWTKIEGIDPTLFTEAPVGQVREEACGEPHGLLDNKGFKTLDRFCRLAVIASAEALADSAFGDAHYDPDDVAIIFGSSTGGLTSLEESYFRIYGQRAGRVHPMTVPRFMGSGAASVISLTFGFTGPAWCISSACASSAHAISEAAYMIKAGRAKAVLAGGAEASVTYGHALAWQRLGALAKDVCRPFSINRTGMALAEGAAALVLEEYETAKKRGATIYGEVTGMGYSSDAYHLTQPDTKGAEKAIRQALKQSGLSAATRFLISTHGTGTELNDISEAAALRSVFGDRLDDQIAVATKSSHGHLMGATGALELAVGLLALKEGFAPPVCNFEGPDPACRLPLAIEGPVPIQDVALLSNSFAFGGLNSTLIVTPV